jgi:hypothetical protein
MDGGDIPLAHAFLTSSDGWWFNLLLSQGGYGGYGGFTIMKLQCPPLAYFLAHW